MWIKKTSVEVEASVLGWEEQASRQGPELQ